MPIVKCTECEGCGKLANCDQCGVACKSNYYICARCEHVLCRNCFKQNSAHQVVCKTHDDSPVHVNKSALDQFLENKARYGHK